MCGRYAQTADMRELMEQFSVTVNALEELQWIVTPAALRGGVKIDVGNAGTVMRFLPPLAALATGVVPR